MKTDTPFAEVFIQFIKSEAGGRTLPVLLQEAYRPHLRVGDGEYLGVVFVDGPDEPVSPGSSSYATVRFMYAPQVNYEALVEGAQFQVLEGQQIVGIGRVTRR